MAASDRPTSVITHPLYAAWVAVWTKLAHIYGGTGGFMDGTYLIAHPREWEDYLADVPTKPTKKLKARRKIARYENVGGTLIDQVRAALFRGEVTRTIGESTETTKAHKLNAWWQNVDGKGTSIADYMSIHWALCGLFGHIVHVMDRPAGATPQTKADEQPPYLRVYTPLDLADWLEDDRGALTAVKLLEAEPRTDLKAAVAQANLRQRLLTAESWEVISSLGVSGGAQPHGFGRLPVVLQYSKRGVLQSIIGKSILSDPNLYIDLYNLTSELRELLRNQAFSILNIILGTGEKAMTVEQAILGLSATGGVGTENVLFSGEGANFITADASNIKAYQDERSELLRTIYRLASIPWEADSRDAEATGSLKLKREDMNQILAAYADECEKAEYQFVELWFRAEYGDRWEKELAAANIVIRYPDTFDVTPFADILEQAQAAVAMEMPATFMKELRRRLVTKFLPDATPDVIKAIDAELEQMAKEPPQTALRRAVELATKLTRGAPPTQTTPDEGDPEIKAAA